MERERIDPLFFGARPERLYGCHHAPPEAVTPSVGVVIAPPLGHEYARSHRALRRLAVHCAEGGARALRFDFGGTGDSAGDRWPSSFDPWIADLELALRELTLRTRVPRAALVGVRLSANLAMECVARRPLSGPLVLWDPLLDGPAYARSLVLLQQRFAASLPASPAAPLPSAGSLECLGQAWPDGLLDRVRAWRIPRFERAPAPRVLLLQAHLSPPGLELARELERSGAHVVHEASSGSEPWNEDIDRGLVPAEDLKRIADFLLEAC